MEKAKKKLRKEGTRMYKIFRLILVKIDFYQNFSYLD
jgi:hypothetical protein